jgi:hypothetical protein
MKKKKTYKAYVCTTTSDWELGKTDIKVYPSIDSLKRHNKCHKECGITELTITVGKKITQGRPSNEKTSKQETIRNTDTKKSILSLGTQNRSSKKS